MHLLEKCLSGIAAGHIVEKRYNLISCRIEGIKAAALLDPLKRLGEFV